MERTKKTGWKILIFMAAAAVTAVVVYFAYQYFSLCSRNTRALESVLSRTGLTEGQKGNVGDLLTLDYDKLYVFAPYETKERMESQIGFKTSLLKESESESMLNYLFVRDGKPAAYLRGYPENTGYCINLKSGVYLKSQLDQMSYETETRPAGTKNGRETAYQDYNFYFQDTIEQQVNSVIVQTNNAVTAVETGQEVSVDLNGSGADTVYYSVKPGVGSMHDVDEFTINGRDYSSYLKGSPVQLIEPQSQNYYIVDLVADDDYKEIAIGDNGPSSDYETHFFRFINEKLVYLGSVTDFPDSETCHFQNQGSNQGEIVAAYRLDFPQTWFVQGYWKLNQNNKLVFQEQSVYYPVREHRVKLLKEMTVYEDRDLESASHVMQPGDIFLTATDSKNWVQIEDKNGEQGWFYIRDYDTISDVGLDPLEVQKEYIEGLQFYD